MIICNECNKSHPLNRCGICDKESLKCPCYDCLKNENEELKSDIKDLNEMIEGYQLDS